MDRRKLDPEDLEFAELIRLAQESGQRDILAWAQMEVLARRARMASDRSALVVAQAHRDDAAVEGATDTPVARAWRVWQPLLAAAPQIIGELREALAPYAWRHEADQYWTQELPLQQLRLAAAADKRRAEQRKAEARYRFSSRLRQWVLHLVEDYAPPANEPYANRFGWLLYVDKRFRLRARGVGWNGRRWNRKHTALWLALLNVATVSLYACIWIMGGAYVANAIMFGWMAATSLYAGDLELALRGLAVALFSAAAVTAGDAILRVAWRLLWIADRH